LFHDAWQAKNAGQFKHVDLRHRAKATYQMILLDMKHRRPDPLTGLYTRIPVSLAASLDTLANTSGRAKQQIVTEIFEQALSTSSHPSSAEVADVLTLDEVADLLRVEPDDVLASIDGNGLPGRRVGSVWRFSRTAIQAWLNRPEARTDRAVGFAVAGKSASKGRPSK
jgi:excisionase family DNA binding protein